MNAVSHKVQIYGGKTLAETGAGNAVPGFDLEQSHVVAALQVASLKIEESIRLEVQRPACVGAVIQVSAPVAVPVNHNQGFTLQLKLTGVAFPYVRPVADVLKSPHQPA
jgi:hypothetical protein